MSDVFLGHNQYGKAEVHMVVIGRDGEVHTIRDLLVGVTLSGDLDDVHLTGDNTVVTATDTQKNTVYAFAREHGVASPEAFALLLGRHFIKENGAIHQARVKVEEAGWGRISVGDTPHPHAFAQGSGELRTAVAVVHADAEWVVSGLKDLVVLKATDSEFKGFPRDPYTTLAETGDRILATAVTARWRHVTADSDWDASFAATRTRLVETFATTYSKSLQQSLYTMATEMLTERPELAEVRMSMPNKHHFVVDLQPFGLENPNEVFHADDRPYGLIEAVVHREGAPDAGPAWDPYPLL